MVCNCVVLGSWWFIKHCWISLFGGLLGGVLVLASQLIEMGFELQLMILQLDMNKPTIHVLS